METTEHNPVSPEAIKLGYEPEALRVRGFVVFIVGFVVVMVGIHALLWWMMKSFQAREARNDPPRSAMNFDPAPPPPNLQPSAAHDFNDAQDMEALRREEDATFQKLGWEVDPTTHEVRIPSELVRQLAEMQRARTTSKPVPPTTTGKEFNSILPGAVPSAEMHPTERGGLTR